MLNFDKIFHSYFWLDENRNYKNERRPKTAEVEDNQMQEESQYYPEQNAYD